LKATQHTHVIIFSHSPLLTRKGSLQGELKGGFGLSASRPSALVRTTPAAGKLAKNSIQSASRGSPATSVSEQV